MTCVPGLTKLEQSYPKLLMVRWHEMIRLYGNLINFRSLVREVGLKRRNSVNNFLFTLYRMEAVTVKRCKVQEVGTVAMSCCLWYCARELTYLFPVSETNGSHLHPDGDIFSI
jgi:hypothetical protein